MTLQRLLLGQLAVTLLIVGYVYLTGYVDRQNRVEDLRVQCEGAKVSQRDSAIAWSVAAAQRERDGDTGTAGAYRTSAGSLWERAARDCTRAYPGATLWPFQD